MRARPAKPWSLVIATCWVIGSGATSVLGQQDQAEPGRPGWSLDSNDGCRIWNAEPKAAQEVTWKGPCKDGIAGGRGELEWRWNGKTSRYVGTLVDGRRQGHGVFTFANGDRYTGQWLQDRFHGRGTLEWVNRDRYEGDFREGAITGRGVWTSANGDRYEGEFLNGRRQGQGEMTQRDGDSYEGSWRNDRPDGTGDGRVDGKRLLGTWKDGCFRDTGQIAAWGRPVKECR